MKTDRTEADAWVRRFLHGWPQARHKLAVDLVVEYGEPQDATDQEITWYANEPWTRTTLYRVGAKHNFPLPHEDVLEQTVNYRVPLHKVRDLIAYDGSLIIDRTRGELSAHCNSQEQNRIMLNIANDIVAGRRSVDDALAYNAQIIRAVQDGIHESYPRELKFKPLPSAKTADPGKPAPLLVHLGE